MKSPRDGHLWLIAGGLSLVLNIGIISLVGIAAIESQKRKPEHEEAQQAESSVWIYPPEAADVPPDTSTPATPPAMERPAVRTTPEQASPPVESARFIGERDTQATSERTPDRSAPPLPSQSGIRPRYEGEIETTESDYQDGTLDAPPATDAAPADGLESPAANRSSTPDGSTPENIAEPIADSAPLSSPDEPMTQSGSKASAPDELYSGPDPVETPVANRNTREDSPAPAPTEQLPTESDPGEEMKSPAQAATANSAPKQTEKQFRGHQRRTAFVGSISRTGRSSLDVENTPLGRYQATISKAVELEWQRNCVRHRDFITPGYLTTRFFVEGSGKVKTVQFIGEMQTGEIQKGFTLNSIRDAEIPPMPASVKRELENEPLELVFRFFF